MMCIVVLRIVTRCTRVCTSALESRGPAAFWQCGVRIDSKARTVSTCTFRNTLVWVPAAAS